MERDLVKRFINYIGCLSAIGVAAVLLFVLSDDIMCLLAGVAWSGMLYVSGEVFPRTWQRFWVTNKKILSYLTPNNDE